MRDSQPAAGALDVAAVTDVGTRRDHNEDACGFFLESPACAVVGVADGVSGSAAGEVASQLAVDVLVRAYREAPATEPAGKRLYRAFQQANIEIHDKAMAVPELNGMVTTLTSVAVENGELTAVHVGDSRLYLVRGGQIVQLTKDHTMAADKVRLGLMSAARARTHPDRNMLTRCMGRELIVSRDRTTRRLVQGDVLLLCSDGLYNVLDDQELLARMDGRTAADAARALIAAANARGTDDNVSAAVVRVVGVTPTPAEPTGWLGAIRRLFGAGRGQE